MSLAPETVPRKCPGCESSRFGDGFVVLDGQGAMLRGLNPTAARVWELIDGTRPVRQIADRIASEFRAPRERALADVVSFLSVLEEKQLLETRGGGGP